MERILAAHERLVRAGMTDLRGPDGTPLRNVPQYKIVDVRDAEPWAVEALAEGECLVVQGEEIPRDEDGNFLTPEKLYRKVKREALGRESGMLPKDEANCREFAHLAEIRAAFKAYCDGVEALESGRA